MLETRSLFAVMLVLATAGTAMAASPGPPGAAACSGCHAVSATVETAVPRLNGRPAGELNDAMIAFKAGKRPGTVMDRIAKGFSEAEIKAIADWYAEQK